MYELADMVRFYDQCHIDLQLWYLKLKQEDIKESVKKTFLHMQK